jgi:periplasmic protein TonB
MFESVLPELTARRRPLAFYESLPVSLAIHAITIAAIVLAGTWKISFPHHSPRQKSAYHLLETPVPPPPPPPPPPAAASPAVVAEEIHLNQMVAPSLIPDVIPIVPEQLPLKPAPTLALVAAKAEAGVVGVAGGMSGGMAGGTTGGVTHGVAGGKLGGVVSDGRLYVERDRPLPLHPVSQVYPAYPEDARIRRWEDSLVVRYVIGKDGRVKEVTVITHADRSVFEEETLKAIGHWRFKPMIKDGQPIEVVHELTVYFKLV